MSYGSSSIGSGSRTNTRAFEYGRTQVVRPKGRHLATVVWLHGLGDTGAGWSQLLETLPLPNIKWICPTAPTRPVTVFGGFPATAWFDVGDLSEDGPSDVEGMDASAAHVANLLSGKFDASRQLSNGSLLEFSHILPMDAVFDKPEDVPEEISTNKRYAAAAGKGFTVAETAKNVKDAVGNIDVLVHSLANGPEVAKPLLETSRKGYLAALSASSYSYVSMLQHFGPLVNPGGAAISLTYIASERIIPGYGGGMSSAKAALESDTKVLAFEAGRKYGVRVNTISAGPLGSRAAKAIGFIDDMIRYSHANAPIQKELKAQEVGNVAAFLLSPLASAITGSVVYVDNGLNAMGLALDSTSLVHEES